MPSTKVYSNNQITIPAEIRKKHNIKPNDIVEWREDENGKIELTFRKKVTHEDIAGIVDLPYKTNAVELKKSLYKRSGNK